MIDKSSQFFAILTAVGEAKHANAIAMGLDWMFTEMGLGDANGTDPIPDRLQTELVNEWRRAPINQIRVDPANPNTVITEQIIPPEVGGEWIREIGLYDVDGDLVAVANCAPSYKPLLAQGSGKTQVVRMNFIVSSSANIVLKIDPAVVLATREYVDLAISEALAKLDAKQSVRAAATATISLNAVQSIDGVALVVGDRVLVTAQAQAQDNGIYVVSTEAWTRAADADSSLEVTPGLFVHVEQGTTNGDSLWQLVTDAPITLGTTGLQFEMIAGGSGVGVGTFRSVTIDALGRVIAGTNPTTLDGYGITDALPVDGTAVAATQLETARSLAISGAASGSAMFDGSANADIELILADSGATPGTYSSVTITAQGLVTAGDQLTTEDLGLGTAATADVQTSLTDVTADRLMKVGAFGLGGPAISIVEGDVNLLNTVSALYYMSLGVNGPFPSFYGWVRVSVITPGQVAYQETLSVGGTLRYERSMDIGIWGPWKVVWDSNSLIKQTGKQDDVAGHVLTTGAYGWGQGGIVLPANTDLNTVVAAGVYRVEPGPNVPAGGQFSPMLVAVGQDTLWQQIIGYNTGTILTRGGVITPEGYVFTPWQQSWDSGNFNPAAYQPALGFTPVEQSFDGNKIYIGYSNAMAEVHVQVDAATQGAIWTGANGVAKVRSAIASFIVGDVGTYGMFRAAGGSTVTGSLNAGGSLFYSDAYGLSTQGPPSGTWQLMGSLFNTDNSTDDSVSIYLRVA